MSDPSLDRAMDGLSMIAEGVSLFDRNYGALPKRAEPIIDNSFLAQIDAVSVDRLRAAIEAMKETGNG